MFKIHRYEGSYFGIEIERNLIEIGDKNYFNDFINIQLDQRIDNLWIIAFKNVYLDQVEKYCDIFNDEINNNKNISLSSLVKKFKNIFERSSKSSYIEYIGLLTELVFIYKCQLENINIIDSYQIQNDHYDFKFLDGSFGEIKKIRSEDNSILVSHKQLDKMKENDILIGVNLSLDSLGFDLLSLFNKINWNEKQKSFLESKIKLLTSTNTNIKVNIENTNFRIIKREYLPIVTNKLNNLLISAQFRIYALAFNQDNDEFIEIIKEKMRIENL